ncbi:hypothetical protein F511_45870 [Dorcoceras hygrometricum]|uniref:Uncharacterized protein n=1 Tax=Dorcoceras hygrometricum TaxID=472368 RepID=A0A2Z6ZUW8_9LAMI|nr:hypothetical protein F511_45870 [Dorcoceras hygrometricum]
MPDHLGTISPTLVGTKPDQLDTKAQFLLAPPRVAAPPEHISPTSSCWRNGGSGSRSRGTAEKLKIWSPAPGSAQFYGEIGTSTVEQLRPPNPIHDRNLNSFAGLH